MAAAAAARPVLPRQSRRHRVLKGCAVETKMHLLWWAMYFRTASFARASDCCLQWRSQEKLHSDMQSDWRLVDSSIGAEVLLIGYLLFGTHVHSHTMKNNEKYS